MRVIHLFLAEQVVAPLLELAGALHHVLWGSVSFPCWAPGNPHLDVAGLAFLGPSTSLAVARGQLTHAHGMLLIETGVSLPPEASAPRERGLRDRTQGALRAGSNDSRAPMTDPVGTHLFW